MLPFELCLKDFDMALQDIWSLREIVWVNSVG